MFLLYNVWSYAVDIGGKRNITILKGYILLRLYYYMDQKAIWTIVAIVVVAFLLWGFIGGNEAKSDGVTCDMGIGNSFCLRWHTNALGSLSELFDGLAGSK